MQSSTSAVRGQNPAAAIAFAIICFFAVLFVVMAVGVYYCSILLDGMSQPLLSAPTFQMAFAIPTVAFCLVRMTFRRR
jgi:hypothetical protein